MSFIAENQKINKLKQFEHVSKIDQRVCRNKTRGKNSMQADLVADMIEKYEEYDTIRKKFSLRCFMNKVCFNF